MPRPLVLLLSIDGLRPDAIRAAEAPTFLRLMNEGSSTWSARTVMPSVTLPCHTSMLRGVDVPRHGITDNVFHPIARPVPSVIDVASRNGLQCACFFNWGPLRDLYDPESVQVSYYWHDFGTPEGDAHVARVATEHLTEGEYDFAFLYMGHTDWAGHKWGWMSEGQLRAVANADSCVAQVLSALQSRAIPLTVLFTSDHGGHGQSHGTEMDEDMTVPWCLWGNGARPGVEIQKQVRIFDAAPTLAKLLGLPLEVDWEGQPVEEALR